MAFQLNGKPIKALVKTITTCRTCSLDIPISTTKRMKTKLISDLSSVHCIRQILKKKKIINWVIVKKNKDRFNYLFVGKNQKHRISKFIFGQHTIQFFSSFPYSFSIIWIDYKYKALSVLKVMPPKWSDLVLSTYIPNSKAYIFIFNRFNVKT